MKIIIDNISRNFGIVSLDIIHFVEYKNKKGKDLPNSFRIITNHPESDSISKALWIVDGDIVYRGRFFAKTMDKVNKCSMGESFTDSSNIKWVITDGNGFDSSKTYINELKF